MVGRIAMLIEPPGAGEQHELDVGEVEWRQRLGAATSRNPGLSFGSSGVGVRVMRVPQVGSVDRASARATSAASVWGKSALIAGPSCGPSVSAAGPLISIR